MNPMIDEKDWQHVVGHLESFESNRDVLLKQSREIQKRCKQATHLLHKGSVEDAAALLEETEALAHVTQSLLQTYPSMRQGALSFAMEEYVQAFLYKVFLVEGRLAKSSEVPLVEPEEYLAGVLDFTEELSRYAIQRATLRDNAAVQKCREVVDGILGQFLQFDLRNSSLRRKYDGLKYTLKKLENTLYELSLVDGSSGAPPS
jgi:predicted translin family RNA/ssDNA-binding protein